MQIVVPDDQLSLAIGRRGQNVRLAAQLSGWKIDITSETRVAEEREVAWASLSRIEGISDFVVQTLYNHGFRRAAEVVEADDEFLGSLPGFNPEAVPRIKASAKDVVKAEKNEKLEVRELARGDARILLAIERAAETQRIAGNSDLDRLKAVHGVLPYVIERLQTAMYDAPEDIYFEIDEERLVRLGGFSPAKARQLKYAASVAVNALSNGAALITAKPLSEPEARDVQQYDAAQSAPPAPQPAAEAAPA